MVMSAGSAGKVCRCGHARTSHEHYRRGTDCAAEACDCVRFRRSWTGHAVAGTDDDHQPSAAPATAPRSLDVGGPDPTTAAQTR
jgi:hypothetical protein